MPSADFRVPWKRGQFGEYRLQPDSVHAGAGEFAQVAFRVGIRFSLQERIAIKRKVRVTKLGREAARNGFGGRRAGFQFFYEVEERFVLQIQASRELLLHDLCDGPSFSQDFRGGRLEAERRALWFVA